MYDVSRKDWRLDICGQYDLRATLQAFSVKYVIIDLLSDSGALRPDSVVTVHLHIIVVDIDLRRTNRIQQDCIPVGLISH